MSLTKVACFSVLLTAVSANVFAFEPIVSGGSNLAWYQIRSDSQPASPTGVNCREEFGIIADYHLGNVRNTVQSQLNNMYNRGQRRLRVPIYHSNGAVGQRTLLDSRGGRLSERHRANISLFLSDIRSAGFIEVEVGYFPIGPNHPAFWPSWREEFYQENLNIILSTRQLIVDSGLSYKIDLMNEGAPARNQPHLKEYVYRVWTQYNQRFGKRDTVGFSIGAASIDRYNNLVEQMNRTGYGLPDIVEIHIYEQMFGNRLELLDEHMRARGDNRNWIIGETFYNDEAVARKFSELQLNRSVSHVYQWPITRNRGCDGHADVTPIFEFPYGVSSSAGNNPPANESVILNDPAPAPVTPQPVQSGYDFALRNAVYSSTTAELFWNRPDASTNLSAFDIYRNGTYLQRTDGISYFDAGLSPSNRYEYRVVGVNRSGQATNTEQSTSLSTPPGDNNTPTTSPVDPQPVQSGFTIGLRNAVYSSTTAELFWNRPDASLNLTAFDIYRNGTYLQRTDGISFFDASLSPGTNYEYRIIAIDGNGQGTAIEQTTSLRSRD